MGALRFCLLLGLAFAAAPVAADTWDDPTWYAAPANPLNLTMTPDTDRGTSAILGFKGGTLKATAVNGDAYTLTIPEGALFTDTEIAMLPVARAEGLPEGSGEFSGVLLKPDGLELAKTATLEITPATPIPPAARALWGFYEDGADARGEINLPNSEDRIQIAVDHFSGAGVSFADRVNLQLDRWKQTAMEDRVSSQLAQMMREVAAGERDIDDVVKAASGDAILVLKQGWTNIANSRAANCDDVNAALRGLVKL